MTINHTASNQFRQRGVASGDVRYVVCYHSGLLRLLARLGVKDVVDQRQAARYLRQSPDEIWEASDHVIAVSAASWLDIDVPIINLRDVSFLRRDGSAIGPRLAADGRLDRQTLRNVREITVETAQLFDRLIAASNQPGKGARPASP